MRELRFRDFDEGMRFLEQVGRRAADHKRHPDMSIVSNRVRLTIANPHGAGITLAELRLAAKVNAIIDELGVGRDGSGLGKAACTSPKGGSCGRSASHASHLRRRSAGLRETVERLIEAAADRNAHAVSVMGDLGDGQGSPESYRAVFRALGAGGLPAYWIPGPADAPVAGYLREAHNVEVVFPLLHGTCTAAAWWSRRAASRKATTP